MNNSNLPVFLQNILDDFAKEYPLCEERIEFLLKAERNRIKTEIVAPIEDISKKTDNQLNKFSLETAVQSIANLVRVQIATMVIYSGVTRDVVISDFELTEYVNEELIWSVAGLYFNQVVEKICYKYLATDETDYETLELLLSEYEYSNYYAKQANRRYRNNEDEAYEDEDEEILYYLGELYDEPDGTC